MEQSTARTLTRVYTVLTWLGALLFLIAAITVLFFLPQVMQAAMEDPAFAADVAQIPEAELASMLKVMSIFLSVMCGILALVLAVVGYGLWRFRNWARICAVVIGVVGVLFGVMDLLSLNILGALISFVLYGGAVWLFGFVPQVQALFTTTTVKAPAAKKKARKKRT